MKKTRNILMTVLSTAIILEVAIVALYESATLMAGCLVSPGADAEAHGGDEYIVMTIMELLTIAMIPAALRLFRLKLVKKELSDGREKALLRWGLIRMMMLVVPMLANTLLYYMYAFSTTFAYMAIILLICLAFVVPTTSRCNSDIDVDTQA